MSGSAKAIFLSYAREDTEPAKRIADALRAFGVEVWFDQSELRGGDQWDTKIRTQIKTCTLFMPIISATTEARPEGYFRREWLLAAERTRDMASGVAFIVPVVTDDTPEGEASVPEEFMRYQWTRLTHGVPSPQFVEQIKRLLESPRKTAAVTRAGAAPTAMPVRGGIPPWIWLAAVIVIGGVATFIATRSPVKEPASPVAPAKPVAAASSEARQLVAKARPLWEPWDLASLEDFELAKQLLKKAVELDPADAGAWADYATMMLGHINNYDRTEESRGLARSLAERAFKLAPDLPAARFAHAYALRLTPETQDEALRLLREEANRQPTNKLIVRTVGSALLNDSHKYAQALVYYDKAAVLPGGDAIAQYLRARCFSGLNRIPEAEAAIDEALALAPGYIKAHAFKLGLLLAYEDIDRAKAQLTKLPPVYLTDENGAAMVALVWLYARDAQRCLDALRAAREYSQSNAFVGYNGPKAYIAGRAHVLLGNVNAAQTEWRSALNAVERRLASQSNDLDLLGWKAMLLAALGDRAGAKPLAAELRQRRETGGGNIISDLTIARVDLLLSDRADALTALERLSAVESGVGGGIEFSRQAGNLGWRNQLRYDPVWDPLRTEPRFVALLKSAETKK